MAGYDLLVIGILLLAAALSGVAARRDLGIPLLIGAPAMLCLCACAAQLVFWLGGDWRTGGVLAALLVVCGLVAEVDRRHAIIPDPLVAALLLLALTRPLALAETEAIFGMLGLFLLFLCVRFAFVRMGVADPMGLGDVKLAAAMGALLGPQLGVTAIAIAGAATLIAVVPATRRGEAALRIPFGVGLASALAFVSVLRLWWAP